MTSDTDQMVGSSIESSEEDTELKIQDKKKETGCELFCDTRSDVSVKENDGNMSGDHSAELMIDSKNEDREKKLDRLEDSPVFYMDKSVTACDMPETEVSDYKEKEHTCNAVKDICVDEGVPMVQEKLLSNKKDSFDDNMNESKSSEEESVGIQDSMKLNQENLIVSGEEVLKDDSEVYHEVGSEKPSPSDVVATSGSVSKEVLTLREIISMENSKNPPNNNETEQEKAEEPVVESLRYLYFERTTSKKPLLSDELEDSCGHHHLVSRNFQNGFGERRFSDAESSLARISYSGAISVSGNLSVRSDESTVSANSFAFPILHSEWNSPERMARDEKRQVRKEKGWRHLSFLLCCRF